jgi:hypothetical protein
MAIALAALCLAPGAGLAAPGDPFGSDDTGCVPDTRDHLHCASALARSVSTLVAQMTRCERQQVDNAFRILHPRFGSPPPPRFDKEGCVRGQAKAPFDLALGKLQGAGVCPPAALVNAQELGDALVAGQSTPGSLDAVNAATYCDATSGTLIDPAGSTSPDAGGYVPSTRDNLRCSDTAGQNLMLLVRGVTGCHLRLARASFNNQPVAEHRVLTGGRAQGLRYGPQLAVFVKGLRVFDEEACERRARERYVRSARQVTVRDMCPPCLDLTAQVALGDAAVATVEQESGRIFICPGGTTSTTITSTTSTTGTAPPTTATSTTTTQAPPTTMPTSTTEPGTSSSTTTVTLPRTTTTAAPTTTTDAPPTTTPTSTTIPRTASSTTTTAAAPTTTSTTSTTLLPCGGLYPMCFGSCPPGQKCKTNGFLRACLCD